MAQKHQKERGSGAVIAPAPDWSIREGVCGSFGSLKALTAAACRTAN